MKTKSLEHLSSMKKLVYDSDFNPSPLINLIQKLLEQYKKRFQQFINTEPAVALFINPFYSNIFNHYLKYSKPFKIFLQKLELEELNHISYKCLRVAIVTATNLTNQHLCSYGQKPYESYDLVLGACLQWKMQLFIYFIYITAQWIAGKYKLLTGA